MTALFPYARGLISRDNRNTRHTVPPFHVGHIASFERRSLSEVLARHMDRFSPRKTLTSSIRIEIALSRDGTRKVFTGRRFLSTSIYPSVKTGTPIVCEGPNELLCAQQCEVDPGVLAYASQAVLFHVRVANGWKRYHADFCRLLQSGRIEILEVKPNPSHLLDEEYREKIEGVRKACSLLGWQFSAVFGTDLQAKTFYNFHVGWIQRSRAYRVDERLLRNLETSASAEGNVFSICQLVDLVSNLVEARAIFSALICQGRISVDLSRPITADTHFSLIQGESQ
jgi:hypothetical protein